MIPNIQKILYATDLSESARNAFGYAAYLSHRCGAKISLLHVMEDLSSLANTHVVDYLGEEKWLELQASRQQEVENTIRTRLEKFCDDMKANHEECPFIIENVLIERGHPVEVILEQADQMAADLIVMGTHGHGLLADALIGSVARRVVRRSHRPVMVIRLPAED